MIVHSFDYPPMDGGISRLCAEVAGGLGRRGVSARTLTQATPSEAGSEIPDLAEIRVTARRPWREWEALRHLRGSRLRGGPVLCGIWYPEGLLATLAGVRPRIIMAHGSELMPPRSRWRRGIWKQLQNRVLTSADLIVANSDYTRRLAETVAPGCRAISVPLAVDHRRFRLGDREAAKAKFGVRGRRVVATVSRLCSYKGHDVVFRAIAALPDRIRGEFTYLIAGKGPDEPLLRETARNLGIEDLVSWLGYVREEDLADLYRATDLFALCTRERAENQEVEGFGLVFLEAQACGTPVVGTRTGGIPDAITEGDGGWLIEPDDDPALTAMLLNLAEDPSAFRLAGDQARRRIEREWTWEDYFHRFEQALKTEGFNLG